MVKRRRQRWRSLEHHGYPPISVIQTPTGHIFLPLPPFFFFSLLSLFVFFYYSIDCFNHCLLILSYLIPPPRLSLLFFQYHYIPLTVFPLPSHTSSFSKQIHITLADTDFIPSFVVLSRIHIHKHKHTRTLYIFFLHILSSFLLFYFFTYSVPSRHAVPLGHPSIENEMAAKTDLSCKVGG